MKLASKNSLCEIIYCRNNQNVKVTFNLTYFVNCKNAKYVVIRSKNAASF